LLGNYPETLVMEMESRAAFSVPQPDFAGVLRIHFLIQERQAASRRRMVQGRQEIEPC
jgi:hypothetical protein